MRLQLLETRAISELVFLAPESTTPDSLTVAAFGARLWPGIRPFLAATAGLPAPWTTGVSWAPSSIPSMENLMISVLSDQPVTDNADASTQWSQQSKAYVDALPAR